MTTECTEHTWVSLSNEEVADLRKKTRVGRPNMSWLENADRCSQCGSMQAGVSWYGQLHRVPVVEETPGSPVVRWPTRQAGGSSSSGGGMGMG